MYQGCYKKTGKNSHFGPKHTCTMYMYCHLTLEPATNDTREVKLSGVRRSIGENRFRVVCKQALLRALLRD